MNKDTQIEIRAKTKKKMRSKEKAEILSRSKRVVRTSVGGAGRGRRCVEKHSGKITACLSNWLHRGKAFLYFTHTHREHAVWPQRRALSTFSHGFHRSSPFLFVFSRSRAPQEWWAEQSHRKSPEWYFGLVVAPSCTIGC